MTILNIFSWITTIIAIASLVAAITPTPQGNWWLGKLYRIIDWGALEVITMMEKHNE